MVALLASSCQKTDILNVVEDAIDFSTQVGKLTKADYTDDKFSTLKSQGFRVWAVSDFSLGIDTDGKIYRGSNFCGGEMGHMVINVDGIPCNCGRKGCWEKYASATALVSQAVEAMQGNKASLLWQTCDGDLNKVEGKTIFEALDMGDETAKAVVDRYLYYVSIGLANVINALQPEAVCIGGGISGQGEKILKPIRDIVKAERYSVYADKQADILPAALGNDAGIIGAALLDE